MIGGKRITISQQVVNYNTTFYRDATSDSKTVNLLKFMPFKKMELYRQNFSSTYLVQPLIVQLHKGLQQQQSLAELVSTYTDNSHS